MSLWQPGQGWDCRARLWVCYRQVTQETCLYSTATHSHSLGFKEQAAFQRTAWGKISHLQVTAMWTDTGICWTEMAKAHIPNLMLSSEVQRNFNRNCSVNTSCFENLTLKIPCMLAAGAWPTEKPWGFSTVAFPHLILIIAAAAWPELCLLTEMCKRMQQKREDWGCALFRVTREVMNPWLHVSVAERFVALEPPVHILSSWLHSIKLRALTSVCDKSDFHLVNPDERSLLIVLEHHGQPSWGLIKLLKGEERRQMAGLGSPVNCDLDTQEAAPICLDFQFPCKRLVFT